MRRVMAVIDKDEDYAAGLAAYAQENGLTPFSVIAFSGIESLKNFALRQSVELLLDGAGLTAKDIKDIRPAQVIRLSEDNARRLAKDRRGPAKESADCVFKYQAADRLFGEVMECYKSRQGIYGDESLKSEIIGVASPIGRCGKTGFAITLGKVLSESCKVMYLNLEECSGLSGLTGTSYRHSLTDLIYALRQGNLNESVVGSVIYQLGKLDYVAPVSCAEDLAEIKASELAALIGHPALEQHAGIIIVDMGNLGMDAFPLLELCGVIYTPVLDDEISQAKMDEWKKQLTAFGGEDILGRVRLVHLPEPSGPDTIEGHFDRLLYGETGDLIRDMLREYE